MPDEVQKLRDEGRLEGFQTEGDDQQDLRRYLGDVADDLLIEAGRESWRFTDDDRRKEQWQDLLQVPLLAKLLRLLAHGEELQGLKNRESVYQRAMTSLMEKGFLTLQARGPERRLLDVDQAAEILQELAWDSIQHDDFRGQVTGPRWRELRKSRDEPWGELEQVDIITVNTVLERPLKTHLSWRHESFCEYFAGARLAELDAEDQDAVARQHARKRQWRWVFRFALSRLEREGKRDRLNHLATCVVRYGNPFVVFDAVNQDKVELEPRLDRLCRWLVHRDWSAGSRDARPDAPSPRPTRHRSATPR